MSGIETSLARPQGRSRQHAHHLLCTNISRSRIADRFATYKELDCTVWEATMEYPGKQRSDKDTDEAPPPSRFLVRQGSSGWMVYDRQRKGSAVIGVGLAVNSRKHKLIASSGCWQPRRNTSVPVEQIRSFGRWCAISIVHAASATMRPNQRHPASSYSMQISNQGACER